MSELKISSTTFFDTEKCQHVGALTIDLDTPETTHGGQPGTSRALLRRWHDFLFRIARGETGPPFHARIEGRIYGGNIRHHLPERVQDNLCKVHIFWTPRSSVADFELNHQCYALL
ncbi:hypothetical protein TNCT_277711 [Trichonephila clavata]|uniref:Uncharacterized protein n=1 Tax=Trichonephila clavata TaxID=2740835 RepID=A0A8X6KDN2_TRICU|nr:hypothetical protein TNCT_277711 [Trichonephila clavata]